MEHEVKVQHREATLVLAKRTPVRLSEIGPVLGSSFAEVYGALEAHGGDPDGPPFVIYHGLPAGNEAFDIEICAPVQHAVEPPAGWELIELPAGIFASVVHVGPYDSVVVAYDALTNWIGSNGFAIDGPPREVYLSDPQTPPDQIRTVVEFPVQQVVAPVAVR